MKTKLLKKLRKKYASQHTITKRGSFWIVDAGKGVLSHTCVSREDAEYCIRDIVRIKINKYISERKYKNIKYYPW